jgi:hypothetical protein
VRCADGRRPLLNGKPLEDAPVRLHAGDILETGTGRLQFLLQASSVPLQTHIDRVQPLGKPVTSAGPLSWLRRAMGRSPALER